MVYDEIEKSKFKADQNRDADKSNKAEPGAIFRRITADGNPNKTEIEEIEIVSPALQRLFYKTCPSLTPEGDEKSFESSTIKLKAPFVDFIWFWGELELECQPVESDSSDEVVAREDLKQVMSLIRKSAIEPYFKVRDSFVAENSIPGIPYEYLWTIYRPGTMVYAKSYLDDWQMFEVTYCSRPVYEHDTSDSKDPAKFTGARFRVTAAAFDWNGSKFFVYEYDFYTYKKEVKNNAIHAQKVFPTTYYRTDTGERDDRKLRADLIQRGRKFVKFCDIERDDLQCNYDGKVLKSSASGSIGSQLMGNRGEDDDDNSTSLSDPNENDVRAFREADYTGHVVPDARYYLRSQPWMGTDPPLGRLRTDEWEGTDLECQW